MRLRLAFGLFFDSLIFNTGPTTPPIPRAPCRAISDSSWRISKGTALRQHKAAREVRQLEAQLAALRRRTRVNEWYLAQLKAQLQDGRSAGDTPGMDRFWDRKVLTSKSWYLLGSFMFLLGSTRSQV